MLSLVMLVSVLGLIAVTSLYVALRTLRSGAGRGNS